MEPLCPAHPAPSIHPWGSGTLGVDEALPSHHCPSTYQETGSRGSGDHPGPGQPICVPRLLCALLGASQAQRQHGFVDPPPLLTRALAPETLPHLGPAPRGGTRPTPTQHQTARRCLVGGATTSPCLLLGPRAGQAWSGWPGPHHAVRETKAQRGPESHLESHTALGKAGACLPHRLSHSEL